MMSDKIPNAFVPYKVRKYRERFVIRIPNHYDNKDLENRLKQEKILDRVTEEAVNEDGSTTKISRYEFIKFREY